MYLDVTGKTVTCTVSLSGGAVTTPTVTESSGVYTATYANASTGILHILWQNTTDGTQHREVWYWDGSDVYLPFRQDFRDAMKDTHSDGTASIDAKLTNAFALARR